MKRIGLAIIAVLFMASAGYVATSWKTTDSEDTSVNGGEIVMLENESATGNNWMSLNTIKTWLLGGTQDATFNAFTTATANLGVASATTGLLNFYNSGSAYPVGLFSVGASVPSVGFRLPGTMPTGASFWSIDTNGYLSNTLLSTLQAALVSGTNIKTINGNSILGSGDLTVTGTGDNLGSATSSDIIGLFNTGTCSGYLKSDGTCDTPSGSFPGFTSLSADYSFNSTASEIIGSWTGTLLASITTTQAAIQALATELDNAVDITAGTGITITDGQLSVTTNTYQPYDANMITWPSAINATEVGYLDGLTDTIANLLSGKQAADANLPTWPSAVNATEVGYLDGVTSGIQGQINGKQATIVVAADCSTYVTAGQICLETP